MLSLIVRGRGKWLSLGCMDMCVRIIPLQFPSPFLCASASLPVCFKITSICFLFLFCCLGFCSFAMFYGVLEVFRGVARPGFICMFCMFCTLSSAPLHMLSGTSTLTLLLRQSGLACTITPLHVPASQLLQTPLASLVSARLLGLLELFFIDLSCSTACRKGIL
jgi:hypothetical protein